MTVWLFFSLATAVFWSIGQVLSKKGFQHISALWSNIFANLVGIFIWIPIALVATQFHISFPTPFMLFIIFLTGVCYMSYFYAISQGKLALTGTLFEAYPLFTILLSFLFLHERIFPIQFFGIFLMMLGGICIVWPEKMGRISEHAWIFLGFIRGSFRRHWRFFCQSNCWSSRCIFSNVLLSYSISSGIYRKLSYR